MNIGLKIILIDGVGCLCLFLVIGGLSLVGFLGFWVVKILIKYVISGSVVGMK